MIKLGWQQWQSSSTLMPREYTCGYCGNQVGSDKGYFNNTYSKKAYIYLCSTCGQPTFFDTQDNQLPGPLIGRSINHLPENVKALYKEMRDDVRNGSYTSAILLGRKLIMHLAVDVAKASEGETFVKYVEHLKASGYIPPNADKALEYMRKLGNEKNHEIKVGSKEEAEKVIKFVEMLLIFMYEVANEYPQES